MFRGVCKNPLDTILKKEVIPCCIFCSPCRICVRLSLSLKNILTRQKRNSIMATAHHHQPKNLFDHGKESQFQIILPFIERIKDCSHGITTNEFRDYFISQFGMCLSTVIEREKRPKWVTDVEDYQKKSEITIFLSFISALDLPDTPSPTEKKSIKIGSASCRERV